MEPVLLQVVGLDEVYQKGNVYRASFDHLCEYKTLEAGGKLNGVSKQAEGGCRHTISMSENVISILTRLATQRKPRLRGTGRWMDRDFRRAGCTGINHLIKQNMRRRREGDGTCRGERAGLQGTLRGAPCGSARQWRLRCADWTRANTRHGANGRPTGARGGLRGRLEALLSHRHTGRPGSEGRA